MEAEIQTAEQLKEIRIYRRYLSEFLHEACERYYEKLLSVDSSVLESYKEMWIRKWEQTILRERIEAEVRSCS